MAGTSEDSSLWPETERVLGSSLAKNAGRDL